jgi:hypothetical protein
MPSSGMWRCVDLVWTDVSEERIASETSGHTRCTQRHIPEDGIPYSPHYENLKSYILHFCVAYLETLRCVVVIPAFWDC